MRRLVLRAAVPVAAVMSLALVACGSTASSSSSAASGSGGATAGAVNVSIINYPGSDASWLAYIAQQQGFFKSSNLNVSFVSLQAGPQAMAALVGGSADIGVLDTDNMAPLLAKGQKYTLLINTVKNFWAVVGSKSLAGKSLPQVVQALKGQSVAAPSVGGTGGRQFDAIFSAYGLSGSAVKIVADPTNVSLTAGRVQAAMTDTIGACLAHDPGLSGTHEFRESASGYVFVSGWCAVAHRAARARVLGEVVLGGRQPRRRQPLPEGDRAGDGMGEEPCQREGRRYPAAQQPVQPGHDDRQPVGDLRQPRHRRVQQLLHGR